MVPGIECELGEGLHWDKQRGLLWLVDITGQQLFSFDPVTRAVSKRTVSEPVGWVLSIEQSDYILLGLKSGLGLLHASDHSVPLRWLNRNFPGSSSLRMNDAKIDSLGYLWAGSMSTLPEPSPIGELAQYSFDRDSWTIIDRQYVVPNGPAFSRKGDLVLHNDSARGITYRYLLSPNSGEVVGKVVWKTHSLEEGLPDGMTFDAEGFVWIAHWGIGEIRRYDPSGQLDMSVSIPTRLVTNVCFGGFDLERLFITTARYRLENGMRALDDNSGRLFEIKGVGVKGLDTQSARLKVPLSDSPMHKTSEEEA